MSPQYHRFMFDVGDSLREALDAAKGRLRDAQQSVARANASQPGARSADGAMAETAKAAIFIEALLNAERARFAAIKVVVK